jgi:acid phosphatase
MRRFAVALALAGACACHTASPQPAASVPARPEAAPAAARHTHENLNAVLWMQTGAEYRASTLQAYRLARLQLDAALADRTWTAAVEQAADPSALPPAVILDLDETVIDNSASAARHIADGTFYSPAAWAAWVEERRARAVPGAVAFLQYAASKGVTPFYVTNRDHKLEAATRDNLAALGVPLDASRDTILARYENGWDQSDKGARRQAVAAGYRILLLVGDNFEDFVSGAQTTVDSRFTLADKYSDYWGAKWIVLPNPTYGSWESAITSGQGTLTDAQTLALKYKTLRTDR